MYGSRVDPEPASEGDLRAKARTSGARSARGQGNGDELVTGSLNSSIVKCEDETAGRNNGRLFLCQVRSARPPVKVYALAVGKGTHGRAFGIRE